MPSSLTVPKFATETEEAEWWDRNRDLVSKEFDRALAEGRLRRGTTAKLALVAEMGLNLSRQDVLKLADAADRRGLTFKEYLSELIHQALEHEPAA